MVARTTFTRELFDEGWLYQTGPLGVYAVSGKLDFIISAVDSILTKWDAVATAEHIAFPPEMKRSDIERFGYRDNFPHLLGDVRVEGHKIGEASRQCLVKPGLEECGCRSDLVLTPAACYPVYPLAATREVQVDVPHLYAVKSYCFRAEPSESISRWQSFRMREFVMIGSEPTVRDFQRRGVDFVGHLATDLGLEYEVGIANDPFFGDAAAIKVDYQRTIEAKFELTVQSHHLGPVACASCNYHQEHFTRECSITDVNGFVLQSACVAFGLERIAMVLLATHGLVPSLWPSPVRKLLKI